MCENSIYMKISLFYIESTINLSIFEIYYLKLYFKGKKDKTYIVYTYK